MLIQLFVCQNTYFFLSFIVIVFSQRGLANILSFVAWERKGCVTMAVNDAIDNAMPKFIRNFLKHI